MLDTVFVHGLVVDAVIGCYDYEKEKTQTLHFDIEMAWDMRKAGETDQLEDALDYNAVSKRVEKFACSNQFQLVEALAENIAKLIMDEFAVPGVRIRLAKPEAMDNTIDVGVSISRGIKF